MAFFDFLGQGIGGSQPVNQNTMVAGTAGTPIGPTYGDISKAAMQYGSKPGSSAPVMAGLMPTTTPQSKQMQPLAPTAPPQAKATMGQGEANESDDSLAMIAKFFAQLLGGV